MGAHRIAVAGLLALFVVCGAVSLSGDSATFDETAHLGAGVAYLETGDFRLNPEHPPLAKLIAAAPLAALGRGGGDYASAAWSAPEADEWTFGFELINGPAGAAARRDPGVRLFPARLAMLSLGTLLCLVVYVWAKELAGPTAGLIALGLAATCPTILAHARLVTTDVPGALGFAGTTWLFWRWTRRPSLGRAAAMSVAFAAALLFKFNAVLLVPSLLALGVAAVASRRVSPRRAAGAAALAAVVGVVAIWAGYGFRYAATAEPGRALPWAALSIPAPAPVAAARDHRLFPEAYLFGLAYARAEATGRTAFLDGEQSNAGWYRYFPEAFLLKTPPAFLALAVWAIGAVAWRGRGRGFDGWCLALPPLLLAGSAIASRFNIGLRHLAPIYPFLCIAMAAPAASWIAARGARALGVAALLAGCGVSFLVATPGYLSYFNVFGGGARGGWRHLVDSNIDWGQDLARLKRWMDANGVSEVDLAYFGTADPRAYGIAFRKIALFMDFSPRMPVSRPEPGRVVAASVTLLQGLYLDADRAFAVEAVRRGLVPRATIEAYLADRRARDEGGLPVRPLGPWLVARGALNEAQFRGIEDALPAGWLARARDTWTPIGRAGDSILIYRVK